MIPGIIQKMLTRQLRNLKNGGIVHREAYAEVSSQVGSTAVAVYGSNLFLILDAMEAWCRAHQ